MSSKVFVGNLPLTASRSALARVFGRFGRIEALHVEDKVCKGRSQRVGIVEFSDPRAADQALRALRGFELDGSKLELSGSPLWGDENFEI